MERGLERRATQLFMQNCAPAHEAGALTEPQMLDSSYDPTTFIQSLCQKRSDCLGGQFPNWGLTYPHGQRPVIAENRWLRFL